MDNDSLISIGFELEFACGWNDNNGKPPLPKTVLANVEHDKKQIYQITSDSSTGTLEIISCPFTALEPYNDSLLEDLLKYLGKTHNQFVPEEEVEIKKNLIVKHTPQYLEKRFLLIDAGSLLSEKDKIIVNPHITFGGKSAEDVKTILEILKPYYNPNGVPSSDYYQYDNQEEWEAEVQTFSLLVASFIADYIYQPILKGQKIKPYFGYKTYFDFMMRTSLRDLINLCADPLTVLEQSTSILEERIGRVNKKRDANGDKWFFNAKKAGAVFPYIVSNAFTSYTEHDNFFLNTSTVLPLTQINYKMILDSLVEATKQSESLTQALLDGMKKSSYLFPVTLSEEGFKENDIEDEISNVKENIKNDFLSPVPLSYSSDPMGRMPVSSKSNVFQQPFLMEMRDFSKAIGDDISLNEINEYLQKLFKDFFLKK